MEEKNKKSISKFLSLVLRHQPKLIGLVLDENGWADTTELIRLSATKQVHFTKMELQEIVATNDKKRFAFNNDESKIRASQGHSIVIDLALRATEPPAFLYHGTAEKNREIILSDGIRKMNRQHVHLSDNKTTATNVGSRHGKPFVFTVLAGQMFQDGILFYLSENGVWLTDYVDAIYISK